MIQGRFGRLRETMSLIRVSDTGLKCEKQHREGGGGVIGRWWNSRSNVKFISENVRGLIVVAERQAVEVGLRTILIMPNSIIRV